MLISQQVIKKLLPKNLCLGQNKSIIQKRKRVNTKMSNVLVNTGFWDADKTVELHLDSRMVFLYVMSSPHRGYLDVFELKRHHASMCLGINKSMVDNGIRDLVDKGYVKVFENYVQLLVTYKRMGGGFNDINANRELESLPVNVREYFYGSGDVVLEAPVTVKKQPKKAGPAPETIKQIIAKQPEGLQVALADFVADRIERKKAPTTRAVKGWLTKLEELYPNDPVKQSASIMQSIERGWMGLFEVRENKQFMRPGEGAFL